ncbi:hypothetical protein EU537_00200 [Candidatus Thorarchaeota archaeon]|nr:MAG: hypothetical protein EU537_00200 [Candidatus Thorarchaeota archaeon]
MQGIFDIQIIQFWSIPLFIGLGSGYALGGLTEVSQILKMTAMPIISIVGGYILAASFALSLSVDWNLVILSILSFLGGGILGMVINWRTHSEEIPKRAIIFTPENDEDFDREIKKALGDEE